MFLNTITTAFNTPLEMRGPRQFGGFGNHQRFCFQYSIGDAAAEGAEEAVVVGNAFNTPLEMPADGHEAGRQLGHEAFQYSIGDAWWLGAIGWEEFISTFNTPLEMLLLAVRLLQHTRLALSILHWRCKLRQKYC